MIKQKLHLESNQNILLSSLVVLVLILAYFNLTTPLWGNMLLAFGAFNQAENYHAFPDVIFYTDYIRGWFYKLIMYIVYKIVGIITERNNYSEFQLIAKVIYYFGCFVFTLASIHIALPKTNFKQKLIIQLSIWTVLLMSGYRQYLESEELAAILVIGHVCFIISPFKWAKIFSGIFIFMLFGCKAVTIVYAGFAPLFWLWFYYDKQHLKTLLLSHIGFLIVTIVIYFTLLKPEWLNISNAMAYQDSAKFSGMNSITKFTNAYIRYKYYLPILVIIPFGFIYALLFNRKQLLFLSITFIIAAVAVIAQNRFSSPYHYLSFIPLSLYILLYQLKDRYWIAIVLLLFPLYYTFKQNLTTQISYPKSSNLLYTNYFKQQCVHFTAMNALMDSNSLIKNDTLLFLTGDCPPYFFGRPNANHNVGALKLNRGMYNHKLKSSSAYISLVYSISNYTGKFILYDPMYLPIDSFPMLQNKFADFDTLYVANIPGNDLGEEQLILFKRKSNE